MERLASHWMPRVVAVLANLEFLIRGREPP